MLQIICLAWMENCFQ